MRSSFLMVCGALLAFGVETIAQVSLSPNNPATQNFNALGTAATATLPASWKISAPGETAPTWSDANNVTATTHAAHSGSPTTGGRYNWGKGPDGTDRSVGFLSSGGYASPSSLMLHLRNTSGGTMNAVTLAFDINRYRINLTAAAVSFFHSTNGVTWTAVPAADVSFAALSGANATYDFTLSGTLFSAVVNRAITLSGLNLASNSDLFLRWQFSTGSTNSQALGLDNVAVTSLAVITTQPVSQVVTSGTAVAFSVAAVGTGTVSYQWRKDGNIIPVLDNPSAGTTTLSLGTVTTAAAGNYDVVITDTVGSTTSATATLTVNKANAAVAITPQTFTYDGNARSASATTTPAGLGVIFTYTATSGTSYGPSTTAPRNAGTYSVAAAISDANYQGSATAAAGLVIAKAPASVVLSGLAKTYSGAAHPVSATTTPAGLSVLLTYNGSTTPPTAPGTYAVAATINDANYTGTATGTLTIDEAPVTIALGALSQTYNGQPRVVTATATPVAPILDWVYVGTGGTTYGPTATPPTNAGTYRVTATVNDGLYRGTQSADLVVARAPQTITFPALRDRAPGDLPFAIVAMSSSGLPVSFALSAGSPSIASLAGNTITLTGGLGGVTVRASQPGDGNYLAAADVDRTFTVATGAAAPVFTVQPESVARHVGDPATLAATVSSYVPATYQWKKDGSDIPGANNPTLVFTSLTLADLGLYTVVATNPVGSTSSTPALLYVTKRPQTITFSSPTASTAAGSSITLSATASSNLPVRLSIVSGAANLAGNLLTGTGGNVVVRATQAGDATYAEAPAVERTFSFVAGSLAPVFTGSPADQVVAAGASVTFRAAAVGTPSPTYQWQKDGAPIAGATASTLTLSAVTPADSARYTIIATNVSGTASASALLTVRAPPVIVEQPVSQTISAGTPVTFSVVATATPAPSYQWRKNGTPIHGATNNSFVFASPVASDGGRFDVVVTNVLGSVTSEVATLTVNTREFRGQYFGRFLIANSASAAGSAAGDIAVHVGSSGAAAIVGFLPGQQTGFAITDVVIDAAGRFSTSVPTLASAAAVSLTDLSVATARAPQMVTVRGQIDDATGAITGIVPELVVTFDGARVPSGASAAGNAGFYAGAILGSAKGQVFVVVAPDGQALVLAANGGVADGARGVIGRNGRLTLSAPRQTAFDLGFNAGALTGSLRNSGGASAAVAGAAGDLLGQEHLVNVSVRSTTTAAAPLITGFVVSGSGSKQVLIRAAGPALAQSPFNVAGALADPTLQLFRGSTRIAQNDEWNIPASNGTAVAAAATRVGAFAFRQGSNDAALVTTLAPGAYTVVIGGGTGTVLAEVYGVLGNNEAPGARRLVNVSARGLATPGAPVIAGFVITGTAPQRVLVRGIGPALGARPFDVPGALANPQLTLFRGSTVVKTNNDWFRDPDAALIREAAARTGAFPLGANSADAAMLLYLEPGSYTAQVSAPTGGTPQAATGIVLVEVYEASL